MSRPLKHSLGHWSTLVEGLQASPRECYAAIEAALKRREVPEATAFHVTYKESSFLSADRLYLRVTRKMLAFDICAAPFGSGFFFSWWMSEVRPSNVLGCLAVFLMLGVGGWLLRLAVAALEATEHPLSLFQITAVGICLVLGTLWVVAVAVRAGKLFSEDAVLAMPLIGSLYNSIFRPATFYKLDTIDMYQKAVHAAVLEVVQGLMSERGLRALAPEECLPKLREVVR